jgi:2-keto-4-pentenoate hydratase/2-oxohepta-3-ene-1,7-dioic acid hydratase in catechol pathway
VGSASPIAHWLRFSVAGAEHYGTVDGEAVTEWSGELFGEGRPTDRRHALTDVRPLMPCHPSKLIGLWNNSRERAIKEGLSPPAHPPYFLKAASSYAGHGETIRRPKGYAGQVVFEAELGIVIGKRCAAVTVDAAPAAIFGYTCVNDVTARDLLRLDPSFVHWTRAKSFDGFGVFGPVIASGIDPTTLRIRAVVSGQERQNYPVSDMFFSPVEIVSRLSQDMTLEPGDIIACGTGVGAGPMDRGDTVEIVIDGIGRLLSCFD